MSALDIVETHEAELAAEAPVETEEQYRKRKLGFFFWASVPQHQSVIELSPTWTDMITRRCVSTYSSSSQASPRLR